MRVGEEEKKGPTQGETGDIPIICQKRERQRQSERESVSVHLVKINKMSGSLGSHPAIDRVVFPCFSVPLSQ